MEAGNSTGTAARRGETHVTYAFPVSKAQGYGSPPFFKEGPGVVIPQYPIPQYLDLLIFNHRTPYSHSRTRLSHSSAREALGMAVPARLYQ